MLKKTLCALTLLSAASSYAHDVMVLPSKSIVAGAPATVAMDITATHGVYRFDKAVGADAITAFNPDGERIRHFGPVVKWANRTSFDLPITSNGTYKVVYGGNRATYMTTYTIGARNTRKRVFASKSAAQHQLPSAAKNVETLKLNRYGVTYITSKMPTDKVLEPTRRGFEVIPLTHPADYINGEPIEFQTLNNGNPVSGVQVAIKSEASLYSDKKEPLTLSTDENGIASVTFEQAGRYSASFNYQSESQDPEADKDVNMVFQTVEVIYE